MPKHKYVIDGINWLPISRAARLLGTNAQGVRKLMADGRLDWRQSRTNSRILVVDEAAVMRLRKDFKPRLKRSPDPLARPAKPDSSVSMEQGTMNRLRARLRNQIEIIPPAPDGGAPGRRRG